MVLATLLRLALPVVLVAGLVLLLLPRPAARILGTLLGRVPAAQRSPRSRRLRRLRTTSGAVALVGALMGARASEAGLVGGTDALVWLLGVAAGVLVVAGVVGVRVTSRRLLLEDARTSTRQPMR